jgi:hypothetical protein
MAYALQAIYGIFFAFQRHLRDTPSFPTQEERAEAEIPF